MLSDGRRDRDDRGGGLTVHERFPAKIMGTVFGIVAMIAALGMALGPPVVGWLFDRLGGYWWLYVASSAIGIAAAIDPSSAPTPPQATTKTPLRYRLVERQSPQFLT